MNVKRRRGATARLVILACLLLAAGLAQAQTDSIYVRIDGVVGDSIDRDHFNWIDCYALDFGYAQPREPGHGAPNPTKAASIAFLKIIDSATVDIISSLIQKSAISTADIDICRAGQGSQDCYYSMHLEDVRIVSHALAGSACLDPATCPNSSSESVELAYARVTWTYRTFDAMGQVKGTWTDTGVFDAPPR